MGDSWDTGTPCAPAWQMILFSQLHGEAAWVLPRILNPCRVLQVKPAPVHLCIYLRCPLSPSYFLTPQPAQHALAPWRTACRVDSRRDRKEPRPDSTWSLPSLFPQTTVVERSSFPISKSTPPGLELPVLDEIPFFLDNGLLSIREVDIASMNKTQNSNIYKPWELI